MESLKELIVSTDLLQLIAGFIAVHLTTWLKNKNNWKGKTALGIALGVSILLGIISAWSTGVINSSQEIVSSSAEIFTIATVYYKLLVKDASKNSTDK